MKVNEVREVENCFDGTFIRELVLSDPSEESFIMRLGEGNELEYHPEFPRPYFKIDNYGVWSIKGVLGDNIFRVIFARNASISDQDQLVQLIASI